jgi:ligand-binding SRPBCC domain-containing protein
VPTFHLETHIRAPREACFDAARDMRLHAESAEGTGEHIVEAPESGMLELGDEVEFEGRHFGIALRLRSKIIEYDRPTRFVDEMQRGPFARLRHTHEFFDHPEGTLMVDTFNFASPLGPLGAIADHLFVARHLRKFAAERNEFLKSKLEKAQNAQHQDEPPS